MIGIKVFQCSEADDLESAGFGRRGFESPNKLLRNMHTSSFFSQTKGTPILASESVIVLSRLGRIDDFGGRMLVLELEGEIDCDFGGFVCLTDDFGGFTCSAEDLGGCTSSVDDLGGLVGSDEDSIISTTSLLSIGDSEIGSE